MKVKAVFQLLLYVAIPLAIGGMSGYFSADATQGEWFMNLNKPSFNPPDSVFGPVWTVLYALMGVSLFLIVRAEESLKRIDAILVFCIQMFLNFWWSIFFFFFERPDVAFGEIVLLWLAIIWMIAKFWKVRPVAAYLQIPYLLWVTFASVLNAAIWWLNK
ncbi:MAG TPA: TspO/MBR family protein [Chitinophagales bacterium]|nr:TspO/MBR family protein [Chitinophagales bacterium]